MKYKVTFGIEITDEDALKSVAEEQLIATDGSVEAIATTYIQNTIASNMQYDNCGIEITEKVSLTEETPV